MCPSLSLPPASTPDGCRVPITSSRAAPSRCTRHYAWVPESTSPARQVAYELLTSALLEIRAATEPGRADPEWERQIANVLAHLAHNWPEHLMEMPPDGDFDALLRRWWDERDRRSDPWLRERMEFLGWRPPS